MGPLTVAAADPFADTAADVGLLVGLLGVALTVGVIVGGALVAAAYAANRRTRWQADRVATEVCIGTLRLVPVPAVLLAFSILQGASSSSLVAVQVALGASASGALVGGYLGQLQARRSRS